MGKAGKVRDRGIRKASTDEETGVRRGREGPGRKADPPTPEGDAELRGEPNMNSFKVRKFGQVTEKQKNGAVKSYVYRY